PLPHGFVRSVGRIFQLAAFVAQVPDVAVAAVDVLLALLDRNAVLFGVSDGVFARIDVPLAPGSDDLQVRSNGLVGQLKADLIVAFAGAAVGKAVGPELQSQFRLALAQDRPRHRSAQQIGVLVYRSGPQRWPDVVADKFLAQVFDIGGRSAGSQRFLAGRFEIFLLADVANHGDHFAAVVFLEP